MNISEKYYENVAHIFSMFSARCCCCLPCNRCSNQTWVVEDILAFFSNRLESTHYSQLLTQRRVIHLQTRTNQNFTIYHLSQKNNAINPIKILKNIKYGDCSLSEHLYLSYHLKCKNVLGDPEVTANLYCNFAYLYWKGCVICSIYLR